MAKMRLDKLLLARKLVETRAKARGLIMAGQVRVDERIIDKAGMQVELGANVVIIPGKRFVSRGGEKMDTALTQMNLDVMGMVCADVGSSTGGFTDCLLQRGAERVYAIDVGKGQLHWKIRNNPRVILMEETNARNLIDLPEKTNLVVIDASFISLRLLLRVVVGWLQPESGRILALIKPQFEAGRAQVGKGGVVRSSHVHGQVLRNVLGFAVAGGLHPEALIRSPLRGPAGNVEFMTLLTQSYAGWSIEKLVRDVGLESSE